MTNSKTIAKWLTGAAVAGALLLATPHKAQAQVSFGVAVNGYPPPNGYYAPAVPYYWQRQAYIDHEQEERIEAARAAQWRHEQWEREHFYNDRDGWRDRDDRRDHDGWRDRDDHRDRDRF